MTLLATIAATIAAAMGTAPAQQYRRVRVVHRYRTYSSAVYEGESTYYSPGECDPTGGGFTTASGGHVFFGEVANDELPLGTKIYVRPAILGRHDFVVEDHFGGYQSIGRLDVWLPCGQSIPNPWEEFQTYTERVVVFYKRVPRKPKPLV